MKYLKSYKIFEENIFGFKEGDMVYVDAYGPRTLSYSDNAGTTQRDMPFRPKLLDFDKDTKYEILHVDDHHATLYDDKNVPVDVMFNKLYRNKMDTDYVMDCIESSFEDLFDKSRYQCVEYLNEIVVNIKDAFVDKDTFDNIFNNEFSPRLLADGYFCNRGFYFNKGGYAIGIQIVVVKK